MKIRVETSTTKIQFGNTIIDLTAEEGNFGYADGDVPDDIAAQLESNPIPGITLVGADVPVQAQGVAAAEPNSEEPSEQEIEAAEETEPSELSPPQKRAAGLAKARQAKADAKAARAAQSA